MSVTQTSSFLILMDVKFYYSLLLSDSGVISLELTHLTNRANPATPTSHITTSYAIT